MLTDIGKELRKLRIDKSEKLLEMAARLSKSASFISAVEVGTKAPPVGFEELVIAVYDLGTVAADTLRRAADRSRKAFTLSPRSPLGSETAGLLARKMDTLSEEELMEIHTILVRKS